MLMIQPMYEGATLLISGQASLEQTPDAVRKPVETPEALARIADSDSEGWSARPYRRWA